MCSANMLFNSHTAGAIICFLLVFYNSKNLNCIEALSFFSRSVLTFLKSNWSSDFGHAETKRSEKRVVWRREIFSL